MEYIDGYLVGSIPLMQLSTITQLFKRLIFQAFYALDKVQEIWVSKSEMLPIWFTFATILIVGFAIWHIFDQRYIKIKNILKAKVVLINSRHHSNKCFLLGNYGIVVDSRNSTEIKVVVPELTQNGELIFIDFWYYTPVISIPKVSAKSTMELDSARELCNYVQEHLKIEQELLVFESKHNEIDNLSRLIANSEVYSHQIDTYNKALTEIKQLLNKAIQLENLYLTMIKEVLLGLKLAQYDPNSINGNQINHQIQFDRLQEEYEYMKDTARAYDELMRYHHQ